MVETCHCCGAPIIKPDLVRGKKRNRIIQIIRSAPGLNAYEIAERLYANDPEGGADANSVRTTICQLNRLLAPHGLHIYGNNGRYNGYRLIKLEG